MSAPKPLTLPEAQDMVRCAVMNLENLGHQVPALTLNPLYKIVHMQLSWALGEKSEYEPEIPEPSDDPGDVL